MFLNLKVENSGRVVWSDEWLASDVGFGGGTGELDDVEAAKERPFMNCSSISVIYSTKISAQTSGEKG